MTRLPPRLQPLWPLVKRLHRFASLVSGFVGRHTRWLQGDRALPRRGTTSVDETRELEPAAIVVHRLPVGEQIRREMAIGTPADHWVFARRTSADVPPQLCLEIAGGTVAGDFGAIVTPGGTIDGETSEYFGIADWREHPLFLRRRLPPVEEVDGTVVVLAARGGNHNYYHFLLDVLPRMGVLEQAMPGLRIDALFAPAAPYQRTFMELAGLGGHRVIPAHKDISVRASRLIVPSIPNHREMAQRSTVDWLRGRLPARPAAETPRRIVVTRGQVPNTRRIVHEDAMMKLLGPRGFVLVSPATYSPQEQIDLFAGAEVVVAAHGAALANLLFLSPGARVLEMFAPSYVNSCYWSITDNIPGARYRYLIGDGAEQHGPGDPMNKILADIDLDPAVIAAAVDELLAD